METANEKKTRLLGMPIGTATARLRKSLLFRLAGQLDMLDCYQCSKTIEVEDDFSIEHKTSWASSGNPIGMFFDLDNIAFSHISCNVGAGGRNNRRYFESPEEEKMRKAAYSLNRWHALNLADKRRERRQLSKSIPGSSVVVTPVC